MKRHIKVEELSSPWEVSRGYQTYKSMIRLKGKWLNEAGFIPDSHVTVIVEQGRLTIIQEQRP